MQISNLVLNYILNWIIFGSDSMFDWIIEMHRTGLPPSGQCPNRPCPLFLGRTVGPRAQLFVFFRRTVGLETIRPRVYLVFLMMYEPKFVNLVFWIVHIVFWKVTPPKAMESLNFCEKVTRNSQSSLPSKTNKFQLNVIGWGLSFLYPLMSVKREIVKYSCYWAPTF